jgi:CTP-dependent riboflavin kinase
LNHGTGIVKKFSRTFDHGPLLDKLKQERMKKFEVTYEGHLAELARIKEAALKKGSFSSAVNAETNRGKAAGLYIDRKIIKTGKLEDLSEQELEAKMKKIIEDYSQILDVTPETELIEGDDKKD